MLLLYDLVLGVNISKTGIEVAGMESSVETDCAGTVYTVLEMFSGSANEVNLCKHTVSTEAFLEMFAGMTNEIPRASNINPEYFSTACIAFCDCHVTSILQLAFGFA